MNLLYLPTSLNIAIVLILSTVFTVGLYFLMNRFWLVELNEDTRKTAENVATRIGVIHAVVLGMMFTNVRVEFNEMILAVESEASALVRLYNAIERHGNGELESTGEQLREYVRFVANEQWSALRKLKVPPTDRELSGRALLDNVWKELEKLEPTPDVMRLKALLDDIEDYRIQRLFDVKGKTLPVFWHIAIIGYLFTLLTLFLPPPTLRRCILVSLYSGVVAIVLLGIFILSHPYSPAAGISPDVFEMLIQESD